MKDDIFISAIIPAAGTGSRYSTLKNKLFEEICGIPVIIHTLKKIVETPTIKEIILCTSSELFKNITALVNDHDLNQIKITLGGTTRQESVYKGLKMCDTNCKLVLIHDGARPLVSRTVINKAIECASTKGNCIATVLSKDTIKKIDKVSGQIIETIDRNKLVNVQTPQVFDYVELLKAHENFKGQEFTDDAGLIEAYCGKVFVSEGCNSNIKITTEEDILIAEAIYNNQLKSKDV